MKRILRSTQRSWQAWLLSALTAFVAGSGIATAQEEVPEVEERTPVLSEEQRDTLRDVREEQIRETLGLGADDELPAREDLSEDQHDLLKDARADHIRDVLDLEDDAEIPRRNELSDEQRDLLHDAREDFVRETLGLEDDFELPERPPRPDRPNRPERPERGERPDRPERPEGFERPDGAGGSSDDFERPRRGGFGQDS